MEPPLRRSTPSLLASRILGPPIAPFLSGERGEENGRVRRGGECHTESGDRGVRSGICDVMSVWFISSPSLPTELSLAPTPMNVYELS